MLKQLLLSLCLPLAAVLLASSCLASKSVNCANGVVCPQGTSCHAATDSCASPEQIAACAGGQMECELSGSFGQCIDGLCVSYSCGDGLVTAPEQCEADPLDVGGATCASFGFYQGTDVDCTSVCTLDFSECAERCGDQIVNGPEECEVGFPAGGRNCTSLAGGNFFDVGLQHCSSLCSLREDHCQVFGWHVVAVPQINVITSAWMTGPDDAFLMGGDTSGIAGSVFGLYHFKSGEWQKIAATPSAFASGAPSGGGPSVASTAALWGTSPTDLWFGHEQGLSHWDGTSVESNDGFGGPVVSISGTATNSVFALTQVGDLYKYDGADWQRLSARAVNNPRAVFARDGDSAFLVGDSINLWAGGNLTVTSGSVQASQFVGVHGFAGDDVWAIGHDGSEGVLFHFDGSLWSEHLRTDLLLHDLSGNGTQALAVGDRGLVLYFDGTDWSSLPSIKASGGVRNLTSAAGFGDRLWAFASDFGEPYWWSGYGFVDFPELAKEVGTTVRLSDVWVHAKDHWIALDQVQLAVGGPRGDTIARHNTSKGRSTINLGTSQYEVLWGSDENNVYAVGKQSADVQSATIVSRFDGLDWEAVDTGGLTGDYTLMDGSSATNIWIAGKSGDVARFDGVTWTRLSDVPGSGAILGLYTASPNFTMLGREGGIIAIYDGSAWTQTSLDPTVFADNSQITAIDGSDSTNVWVISESNTFFHYDASRGADPWRAFPHPGGAHRFAQILVLAPDEAFAFSEQTIAHFDGEGWSLIRVKGDFGRGSGISGFVLPINNSSSTSTLMPFTWTRRWACKANETECGNSLDDDCDGYIDSADSDC